MTVPVSVPLPVGAQRLVLAVAGTDWRQSYVLDVVDGREWRVVFATNRLEATSHVRARAEQPKVDDLQARILAAPDTVRHAMRQWMKDRRMRLSTITTPDLVAAHVELVRLLDEAAPDVAAPAPDVPSADTAVTPLDGEATSDGPVAATSPKPFTEMSLPELVEELRARGIDGRFEDRVELVDFLEAVAAEEAEGDES